MIARTQARAVAAIALAACVLVATAQSPATPRRIGILTVGPPTRLLDGMRELGYVEGRDVVYDVKESRGDSKQVETQAAEFARQKVDVIVAMYPGAALAARRATATIPIVMVNTPDPVQLGIVGSLAHPSGNVTGTTSLSVDVSVKQLQILKEAVPRATRIALLWNPDSPWHPLVVDALRKGVEVPGVQVQTLAIREPAGIDSAFQSMLAERADAFLVLADPMLHAPANRARIAELALRHRLPSMGGLRGYAEAGGLMSYWADESELYRRVASYVDRILKGTRIDRLPIEQPTKYELVVNRTTAKALGRPVPRPLLLRATLID